MNDFGGPNLFQVSDWFGNTGVSAAVITFFDGHIRVIGMITDILTIFDIYIYIYIYTYIYLHFHYIYFLYFTNGKGSTSAQVLVCKGSSHSIRIILKKTKK